MKIQQYQTQNEVNSAFETMTLGRCYHWNRLTLVQTDDKKVYGVTMNLFERIIAFLAKVFGVDVIQLNFQGKKITKLSAKDNIPQLTIPDPTSHVRRQSSVQVHAPISHPEVAEPVILADDRSDPLFETTQLNGKSKEELRAIFRRVFAVQGDIPLSRTRTDAEYRSPRHEETAVFFYPKSAIVAGDKPYKTFFALNDDRIFRLLKTAQKKNVIIKLVDSIDDMNTVLDATPNISYLEIGAHGNKNSIHIGNGSSGNISASTVKDIHIDNIKEGTTVLLSSCQTGHGTTNIASKMSEAMKDKNITVMAPEVSIAGKDVTRVRNRHSLIAAGNPIYVGVLAQNGRDVTKCYRKGKVVKSIDLNVEVNSRNYHDLSFMDEELRERYFTYLKGCGFKNKDDETVTMEDWLANEKGQQKIFGGNSYSRKGILKRTLSDFYKEQHLAYNLTFTI